MIRNKFYLTWIFSLFCISAIFSKDSLEVLLSTKNPLINVSLSKEQTVNTSIDHTYLEKLYKVLEFDLGNSGYFFLEQKEKKPSYIFSTKVEKNTFFLSIYSSLQKKKMKTLQISLLQDLSIDRKNVHRLSDEIIKEVLNKKGIASSQILFTVRKKHLDPNEQKWISEVWISDYDGANAKQLTFENRYCVHPLFFPHFHDRFLFVSYRLGQPKIFIKPFNQNNSSLFLSIRGNQLLPVISKSGDKMAFICDAAGRPDLFLQYIKGTQATGKPIQLFSSPRATQASPTFSPDGKKIAFVSDKDGPPRIYVMALPEKFIHHKRPNAYLITKKNRHNVTPSWSLDGTKLAYSAKTDGIRQIWIYDFETDEEWQLTKGPMHKENPSWAPDSLHIVYNTEDKISSELFLININQKVAVKICDGFEQTRFPSWGSYDFDGIK